MVVLTKNCADELIMVRAGVSPELVFSGPPELIMFRAGVSPEGWFFRTPRIFVFFFSDLSIKNTSVPMVFI